MYMSRKIDIFSLKIFFFLLHGRLHFILQITECTKLYYSFTYEGFGTGH